MNLLEKGFGDSILNEIRTMRVKAETMRNVLLDPKTASITVVTIPEKAAVEGEPAPDRDCGVARGSRLSSGHQPCDSGMRLPVSASRRWRLRPPTSRIFRAVSGKTDHHPARLRSRGEGRQIESGGRGSLRKGQMDAVNFGGR